MNQRQRWLAWGLFLGAVTGVLTAYFILQRARMLEQQGKRVQLTTHPMAWIKVILSVVHVVRQALRLLQPAAEVGG